MSLQGKQDHGLPCSFHIPTVGSGDSCMWRELKSEDRSVLRTNWELQEQIIHSVSWLGQRGDTILNSGTGGPGFTEEPSNLEQWRAFHDANPECLLVGCCMLEHGYDGSSGLLGSKSWASRLQLEQRLEVSDVSFRHCLGPRLFVHLYSFHPVIQQTFGCLLY